MATAARTVGEAPVVSKSLEPILLWTQSKGNTIVSVTSDGTTGEQWIDRFSKKNVRVSGATQEVLRSINFGPSRSVTTRIVLVPRAGRAWPFTVGDVVADALRQEWRFPNLEDTCLVRHHLPGNVLAALGLTNVLSVHHHLAGCSARLTFGCDTEGDFLGTFDQRAKPEALDTFDGFMFAMPPEWQK